MYKKFEIVHFVGIGGIGMSGIAEVLRNLGYEVRGSDLKETETTRRLRELGIKIMIGHRQDNIDGAHVVVISSAVMPDNPEVIAAKRLSIPVIPRAEMLAELARLKYSVLIAGAHGKTTTTSLIATILASGGLDPTVVIGGKLKGLGSNAKLGQGKFLVAEADESDGSFLKLSPTIAVVTNIGREHMDYFKSLAALKEAFLCFINKVPFYGLSILCSDNEHIMGLIPNVHRRYITYGLKGGVDLRAVNISRGAINQGLSSRFEAVYKGESLGFFDLPLIGLHSISNALAAIAVALELELDIYAVKQSLRDFGGVQRRFEFKGEIGGIRIFDDYGHHPTEIKAMLGAAKENISTGLIVLFQPHRYTRTRDMLEEFSGAFKDADKVLLMDIYAAGESPIKGIDSSVLFNGIKNSGCDVDYIKDIDEILKYLLKTLRPGDTFLTLGAGDVWKIGEELLDSFKIGAGKGA
ncbi:MAG TPA: UDP-N-acetylmuramate--L-alanine ligase [Nitrospiraceae bacterium]|nr:UDP-N-acetylmuramate--L-alanine ligase [Nitrospiraceae bacterium]